MENCIFSLCLDVRNFLKLLKKTCLHKGGFQDFFDIHFSLWTFGGSTVKFFSGSQRASHLCSPEKNFTVSPPNVCREKFMSKKSWKPPLCRRVFFNASRNFYIRGKREEQAIVRTDSKCTRRPNTKSFDFYSAKKWDNNKGKQRGTFKFRSLSPALNSTFEKFHNVLTSTAERLFL